MKKGGRGLPWETEEAKEFDDWFDLLDEDDKIQVIAAKDYLAEHGPAAKMPVSYPIKRPNACGMKELRPGSKGRSELRALYAFDHRRKAILLLGGDKAEVPGDWDAWYDRNVPIADRRFSEHVKEVKRKEAELAEQAGTAAKLHRSHKRGRR
jgi:hypothetical protein